MRFRTATLGAITVLLVGVVGSLALDLLPVSRTGDPGKDVDAPTVTTKQLNDAYDQAVRDANERKRVEDNLPPTGKLLPTSKDVAVRHQRFLAFDNITGELDQNASFLLSGSISLKETLGLDEDQATFGLAKVSFQSDSKWSSTIIQCQQLFQSVVCNKTSKYRTADGTCNNLDHPTWGRSHNCMGRLVPAVYNDGLSEPRKSKSNNDLPNIRNISLLIHETQDVQNSTVTQMVNLFGEFVTHDIVLGLMTRTITDQSMLSCCPIGKSAHPECSMGIKIPENKDDFFRKQGQTCMNFVRSALCNRDCTFGPRQQSNRITAYVDSSNIYGSTQYDLNELRSFQDGLLKSQMISSEEYLPYNKFPKTDQCSRLEENLRCFKAGDDRVNEQPALSSLHNLLLRQHNRLSRQFKQRYPAYDDEQLFQLTRRVVIGQYQNIIFSGLLPVLLGPRYMEYFSLNTGKESVYEPDTETTIFNEFMGAAFRFGHTLVRNTLGRGLEINSVLNFDEIFFAPFIMMQGEFDPILLGLSSHPAKGFDRHLATAVTHNLYRQKEVPFGMDLASLNIQRGRDHGIASYTKYIEYCFNRTITSWEDLDNFMSAKNRMNLQNVYESPDDIDLFTGGVSEDRLSDGIIGPTFACITGKQFHTLKFGDRFYFEHKDQAGSFTDEQLKELRKVTLAHIICKNTKSVKEIVPNVFNLPSNSNQLTPCTGIPDFDLTLF